MDDEVTYLPDDEERVPAEDLSALLAEGTQASVSELCANAPSVVLLLGGLLLVIAMLIVAIRIAWAIYAADIENFYREVAADGGGPLAGHADRSEAPTVPTVVVASGSCHAETGNTFPATMTVVGGGIASVMAASGTSVAAAAAPVAGVGAGGISVVNDDVASESTTARSAAGAEQRRSMRASAAMTVATAHAESLIPGISVPCESAEVQLLQQRASAARRPAYTMRFND
mmetsp:Transcript_95953/g.309455  ORF Transcript_95953/g.309455 Transcript_95953/m.309455 type:complete len:230 (-) Transcript_95953:13-702(-)